MDLREWLIVIGVIIIAGIILDGIRRMRLAKKDSLTMSKEMGAGFESTPLDDDFNPELPNGGARIVATESDAIDEDLGEFTRQEPSLGGDIEVPDGEQIVFEEDSGLRAEKPLTGHAGSLKETKVENAPLDETKNEPRNSGDELVMVVNVHSKHQIGFPGKVLRELLEACGLNHGDMKIFHRHEEDDLLSPIQFSVANAVEPGYFDLETMDQMATPCISFFMSIPGPKDYSKAFEYMLETAKVVVKNLDGEMKDENHSIMTAQTIEHCKTRIKEFERKQLSKVR